jgi:outer membrane lipase/esterase
MKLNLVFRSLKNYLFAAGVLLSASTSALASYSEVVFFGDSLTDTGNLYAYSGVPVSPPYFNGRFSNGPLWSETLAGWLGSTAAPSLIGGNNYAWAGATVMDYGRMQPEIPQQLFQYLTKTGGIADPGSLYVILGGANDINEASANPATAGINLVKAAYAIDGMVDALYAAGARNILVGNLPDIGLTPLAMGSAGATALTIAFNSTLKKLLEETETADAGLDLDVFDLYGLLNSAVANPSAYGFSNVTDACKTGPLGTPGAVCNSPDSYLFWDAFHPSARAHALMAQTAFRAIPEPSVLLLFAAALMGLISLNPSKHKGRAICAT